VTNEENIPLGLSKWCVARLTDSRESDEIERDVSDAVIEREAAKLEVRIFQVASSFVDNEFDGTDGSNMSAIELTFRLQISEESLDDLRRLQETGEFGVDEALALVRDAMPAVDLLHVEDSN
jgi:hypothetical protein